MTATALEEPAEADHVTEQARAAARAFDGGLHALAARLGSGLSPISLALAGMDWALHLASQPAQAALLALRAQQGLLQAFGGAPGEGSDARFADPAWQPWPLSLQARLQHAAEQWWAEATALRGMQAHHRELASFTARQWLDMLSPSNAGLANPEVLQRTLQQQGANLARGALHALDDWRQRQGLAPLQPYQPYQPQQPHQVQQPAYQPGVDVAVTPGRVVHRNHLVELIQYLPQTPRVHAEPVFIVPSWIMKYYILDLSPHNSLVRWLVAQGHTVFILSWRNPDESDALLDLHDYLELGVLDALAAIGRLCPGAAVQACGYCLGGTLLAIAAAALARGDLPQAAQLPALQSVSLLAAETDFSEPGEMGVLIDESQVALLEDMMAERGYLSGRQMAGSFTYLHARELYWSQALRRFWLGEAAQPNDLMAWNADVTRMPAAMHSEYLRRFFLHNDLAEGRYPVAGRPVRLSDLRLPLFVVGTEQDHVSPWRSVHKLHRLCDAELCFVLASGGHNAGIVSEPGHARRHYALLQRAAGGPVPDPDEWQAQAPRSEGSWWPAWHDWLLRHGSGGSVEARVPPADAALGDAPGGYVQVRYDD